MAAIDHLLLNIKIPQLFSDPLARIFSWPATSTQIQNVVENPGTCTGSPTQCMEENRQMVIYRIHQCTFHFLRKVFLLLGLPLESPHQYLTVPRFVASSKDRKQRLDIIPSFSFKHKFLFFPCSEKTNFLSPWLDLSDAEFFIMLSEPID